MANYYSDPLRPARPGRINAQVQPTPTYHGESLVPDYSKWMPGLADYDRLQRNRAAGVPVGQYGPAFPPVPQPAPATAQQPAAPPPTPSAISDGVRRFFPNTGYYGVGTSLTPYSAAPSPSVPGITPGVKPPALPGAFPGAAAGNALAPAPVTPHLFEGMPSGQWFKQQAQRTRQSNAFATYDPQADAPEDDGLEARAMHAGATFTGRPHFTREQLAKMDAASLAALALWPRAPELRRQWRTNPASLPVLKQETPTRAQALAARALLPRFGPGGSSSTPVPPLTRSGPRSAAELAKLDPATLAALALQPRAPLMRESSGLAAAPFNSSDDADAAFHADPQSYLQPAIAASNGAAASSIAPQAAGFAPSESTLPNIPSFPRAGVLGPALKTDPDSLLQPASPPPPPAAAQPPMNPLHIPTEGEPQPPLTAEQRERMNLWKDIQKKSDDLVTTGNRLKDSLKGPNYSGYGEPFESRVENTLSNTVPYLKLFFAPENRVGLLAGAKFIGEENSTIKGLKGLVVDGLQDLNAGSGRSRYDRFDFHHDEGRLPALRVPEEWVRGNPLQKLATQGEPLLHDVGPANLKVKTAAEMDGTTSAQGVRDLSKILVTAPGTARVTAGLVHNAMAELHPLIKDKPEEEQAQIVVDYLREGPEKFWNRVKGRRHFSDEQLNLWKTNPDAFASSQDEPPQSLDPNPKHFYRSQFEQLHKILSGTPSAKLPAMWSPPNY